jgi:hypothetical protein
MRTYDPTEVTISYNSTPIDGFGPGTFIKVNRNVDAYTLQMGNSGSGARSKSPDKSGTIEITLLMSSPANGLLSAIQQLDELSGEGVGEFLVKDRSTAAAKCQAQNAWIKKPPDWDRGKEVGEVTWVLESDNIDILHDGTIDA